MTDARDALIADLAFEREQQEVATFAALGEASTYRLMLLHTLGELEEALRLKEGAYERLRQVMGTAPWLEDDAE